MEPKRRGYSPYQVQGQRGSKSINGKQRVRTSQTPPYPKKYAKTRSVIISLRYKSKEIYAREHISRRKAADSSQHSKNNCAERHLIIFLLRALPKEAEISRESTLCRMNLPHEGHDGAIRQGLLLRHGEQRALSGGGRYGEHLRLCVANHNLAEQSKGARNDGPIMQRQNLNTQVSKGKNGRKKNLLSHIFARSLHAAYCAINTPRTIDKASSSTSHHHPPSKSHCLVRGLQLQAPHSQSRRPTHTRVTSDTSC